MSLVVVAVAGAVFAWLAGGRAAEVADLPPRRRHDRFDVVIPARDEATSLPRLLESLRRSAVVPQRIIVVDDGSVDATADIARRAGAQVVQPGDPPVGWTGKCWACHHGAAAATADVVVFLDADVRVEPSALGRLLAHRRVVGGLVSVQPHHRTEAPYEQLSGVFNAVTVLGSGAASPIPRWRRDAAAGFGPCLVTSAADYRQAGGHAAVRDRVAEDLALAARYRASGLPTEGMLGGDQIVYRMYPDGVRQLVDGWSKNLALGASIASRPAVVATTVWIMTLAAVAAAAVSGTVHWGAGGQVPWSAAVAWTIAALGVRRETTRVGTFGWAVALAFPLPLVAFVGVFGRSAVATVTRRPVLWRGRPVIAAGGGADEVVR